MSFLWFECYHNSYPYAALDRTRGEICFVSLPEMTSETYKWLRISIPKAHTAACYILTQLFQSLHNRCRHENTKDLEAACIFPAVEPRMKCLHMYMCAVDVGRMSEVIFSHADSCGQSMQVIMNYETRTVFRCLLRRNMGVCEKRTPFRWHTTEPSLHTVLVSWLSDKYPPSP